MSVFTWTWVSLVNASNGYDYIPGLIFTHIPINTIYINIPVKHCGGLFVDANRPTGHLPTALLWFLLSLTQIFELQYSYNTVFHLTGVSMSPSLYIAVDEELRAASHVQGAFLSLPRKGTWGGQLAPGRGSSQTAEAGWLPKSEAKAAGWGLTPSLGSNRLDMWWILNKINVWLIVWPFQAGTIFSVIKLWLFRNIQVSIFRFHKKEISADAGF